MNNILSFNFIFLAFIFIVGNNFCYAKVTINRHFKKSAHYIKMYNAYTKKNYRTHPHFTILPVSASGHALLPSNANNFHGAWNAVVNPRTGQVSFNMPVASFLYNTGKNRHDLNISYASELNPNSSNFFGLGSEWSWNIGTEHESTSIVEGHQVDNLSLGDGNNFTMIKNINRQGKSFWKPLRHKIHDVVILGEPKNWTIILQGGKTIHLLNGYEDWEQTPDGKRIWFYYDNKYNTHSRRLLYICAHTIPQNKIYSQKNACPTAGIKIEYKAQKVIIQSYQTISINLTNGQAGQLLVSSIVMPPLSSKNSGIKLKNASLFFSYDAQGDFPWLLHSVTYPTNESVTFLYNSESKRTNLINGLPTGINGAYIPVVTEQVFHNPMLNIPDKHMWYSFQSDENQHNYTGYQAGTISVLGKDNLLDRPDNYVYNVTQDNGITKTITTYNKYHLPLKIIQQKDSNNGIIADNTQTYPPWKNTTFDKLPANYSFAKSAIKTIHNANVNILDIKNNQVHVTQQYKYDNNGQPIWNIDPYGRQEFIQYCPLKGNNHCVEITSDFPETPKIEKIIRLPALSSKNNLNKLLQSSEAVEIVYDYHKITSLKNFATSIKNNTALTLNNKLNTITNNTVKVAIKSVGIIANIDSLKKLKPGDSLPELKPEKILTRTIYNYNQQSGSPFYGLLSQVKVLKYNTYSSDKFNRFSFKKKMDNSFTLNLKREIDHNKNALVISKSITPSNIETNTLYSNYSQDKKNEIIGRVLLSLKNGKIQSQESSGDIFKAFWYYDAYNRPIKKVLVPSSGGFAKTITWSYIFSQNEISSVKTNPDGSQTKTITDEEGKILSTWHRFKNENTKPLAGIKNWIPDTLITYNTLEKPSTKTIYFSGDSINGQPEKTEYLTTHFGYDDLSRPVWQLLPDGTLTTTVYDDINLRTISFYSKQIKGKTLFGDTLKVSEANVLGKTTNIYVFALNPSALKNDTAVYSKNLQYKLTNIINHAKLISALKSVDSSGVLTPMQNEELLKFIKEAISSKSWLTHTKNFYDSFGRKIASQQPNGATSYSIWKNANLVGIKTPDKNIIKDTFDLQGHKTSRCMQLNGSNNCHILGSREYNKRGNIKTQTDQNGNTISYSYDQAGRIIKAVKPSTKEEPNGHILQWTYNSLGPLTESVDGKIVALYKYDTTTWQITDREDNIRREHYSYDNITGKLSQITYSYPINIEPAKNIHYPTGNIKFVYNRYNKLMLATDLYGNKFYSMHDYLGRLTKGWVLFAGDYKKTLISAVNYDIWGRVKTFENGKNIIATMQYNNEGQLYSKSYTKDNVILNIQKYSYNTQTGNITKYSRFDGKNRSVLNYKYDINNNLTAMSCNLPDKNNLNSSLCPRDIDLKGSHLKHAPIIISQQYLFDTWNNIKKVEEKLLNSDTGKILYKTVVYNYNNKEKTKNDNLYDPHKMLSINTSWSNQSQNLKPTLIKWDSLGRMIRDLNGNLIHYDVLSHQDKYTNISTGEVTKYSYDIEGHQIAIQEYNRTGVLLENPRYMVYQGDKINSQVQKDSTGKQHVSMEIGDIAQSVDGKISRWYLHNYKGDIISIYNNQLKPLQKNVYSPYGMQFNLLKQTNLNSISKIKLNNLASPLFSSPGFDGQMTDISTGYQFLGGGYRAYNPIYRHFMIRDSYSPFKTIDGYGFAGNNPIMSTDPSGHMPKWANYLLGGAGIAASVGLGILMPVMAAGISTASASLIASAVGGAAIGLIGAASGSLQVASTAKPNNKKLAIASQAFNIAAGIGGLISGSSIVIMGLNTFIAAKGMFNFATFCITTSSGLQGAIGGAAGIVTSAIESDIISHPNLAADSGFKNAISVLSTIAITTMIGSLISDVGAGIAKGVSSMSSKASNIISEPINGYEPTTNNLADIIRMQEEEAENESFARLMHYNEEEHIYDTIDEPIYENSPGQNAISSDARHFAMYNNDQSNGRLFLDLTAIDNSKFMRDNRGHYRMYLNGVSVVIAEMKHAIMQDSAFFRSHKDSGFPITWFVPSESYFNSLREYDQFVHSKFQAPFVGSKYTLMFNFTPNPHYN